MKKIIIIIALSSICRIYATPEQESGSASVDDILGNLTTSHILTMAPTSVYRIIGQANKFNKKKIGTWGYLGYDNSNKNVIFSLFFGIDDLNNEMTVNSFVILCGPDNDKAYKELTAPENAGCCIFVAGTFRSIKDGVCRFLNYRGHYSGAIINIEAIYVVPRNDPHPLAKPAKPAEMKSACDVKNTSQPK